MITLSFATKAYGRERAQDGRVEASSGHKSQNSGKTHKRKSAEGRGERRRREQVGDRGGGGILACSMQFV